MFHILGVISSAGNSGDNFDALLSRSQPSKYSKMTETPTVYHNGLKTTFHRVPRRLSDPVQWTVWQFRGIKHGNIPARFLQASMNERFQLTTDATKFGYACPKIL
jgi:hypothetical protein